jgi:hypothetical protein
VNFFVASYDETKKKWHEIFHGIIKEEIRFWKPLEKYVTQESKPSKKKD